MSEIDSYEAYIDSLTYTKEDIEVFIVHFVLDLFDMLDEFMDLQI